MLLVSYASPSVTPKESRVPLCRFNSNSNRPSLAKCVDIQCVWISQAAPVFKVCALVPVSPPAFCSSRAFLGVWVLLAGCQSLGSGVWPGSQPVRNFTLFSFSLFNPLLHNFHPCPALTTSTELTPFQNRQRSDGSPVGCKHMFSLACKRNWVVGWQQSPRVCLQPGSALHPQPAEQTEPQKAFFSMIWQVFTQDCPRITSVGFVSWALINLKSKCKKKKGKLSGLNEESSWKQIAYLICSIRKQEDPMI